MASGRSRRRGEQVCGKSCGGRADAHLAAARALDGGAPSATYNIGRGEGFSVLEVLRTIGEVTGLDVTPEVVARRTGDPARVVAAVGRIQPGAGLHRRARSGLSIEQN